MKRINNFQILFHKELRDNLKSWKFIILLFLILGTSYAAIYGAFIALTTSNSTSLVGTVDSYFFLKLFLSSDGTVPSFYILVGFLAPLLGLTLGFDAINTEFNNRTISKLLAQPIYRDHIILTKLLSRIFIIAVIYIAIILSAIGFIILKTGLFPSTQEVVRLFFFYLLIVTYLGLWLNLAVLFSVIFKQPATAAILGITIWIFYLFLYPMLLNVVGKLVNPGPYANQYQILAYQEFMLTVMRFSPTQLFEDGTSIILSPLARSINPIANNQFVGAIPNPLSIKASIQIVWSQLSALIALSALCFAACYWLFMRKEIRA
ncbi:ABC transporter permease [Sphingobacterium rhinopitheci]|uniref:ABC transporter permease n=1 Tax=Sphingobacterium rhinopitheci TaxID=2781960 RepID=UPI001F51E23B|nr:ABC transporter permease subunit [Sphingobacterium rhinopitheci]MCI0921748.1 ABC transporter permease [Sphingobacterium rhinopitheci]